METYVKKKKHMKAASVQVKFQFRGKRLEISLNCSAGYGVLER